MKAVESMMAARRHSREIGVPTVHRFGPYRFFFFYSQENQLPPALPGRPSP
jgi:hypothetical protein